MSQTSIETDRFRKAFILTLLILVGATFLGMVSDFLIALVLAGVFAALLYPTQERVSHRLGGRRYLAASLILVGSVVIIGLPIALVLGVVVTEALQVSKEIQPWMDELLKDGAEGGISLPEWLPYRESLEPYRESILDKFAEATRAIGQWLAANVSTATRGTLSFLLSLFIMLYAMFFFLTAGPRLTEACRRHLPLAPGDWNLIMDRGMAVTRASLKGIIVIGVLQGFLMGLALWAAGISGAAFWGTLTVLLSAVPGLGAPLVWIPSAAYLLLVGETTWGVGMILWGGVVIGAVDNILRPAIVGRDTKLPDLLILVATLGGIIMFGPVGILLGPILASLLDTVINIYRRAFDDWLPAGD